MKPSEWEQLGLALRAAKKRSRRSGNPGRGLDVGEILPSPAEGEECLLTSPSIGLSHSHDWEINEISDVKVTTFGNTAVATGGWQGKGTGSDGKPVDAHERWVDTWMKMPNGKWQCIASAGAPVKM